ncbi:MAG: OmpA family protein, partial [Bacteroidia bacterium]|nr:OmpA family protein [Bacteroidia bacterium]
FFTRCESINLGEANCRLYYSQRPNGFWMEPEPLLFFDEATNFGQPTLIENDSVLIFSASPKGSDGTYDLFYSVRLENGWSEAEIMPAPINTAGNENFPTSFKDTLYFASDFHIGYGGLDIFKTYLRPDGTWAPVQNLGYPINSGADDFGLAIKPGFTASGDVELEGYFASARNTGFGDDIFSFTIFKPEDTTDEKDEPVAEEPVKVYDIYLAGRVVGLVRENDDPNAAVKDVINLDDAYIRMKFDGQELGLRTNPQGRFIEKLELGKNYDIIASKVDYLNAGTVVSTIFKNGLIRDTTINIEIPLEKIIYDTEIILENIYYDFDKWDIRDDARPSLDTLSQLLDLNPQLTIQLSSHTDCRGELEFNNELSQKRAQSAVSYLSEKGIDPNRLVAKGYGETSPAIPCPCDSCTEEEHQVNRRTTFKILKDRQD